MILIFVVLFYLTRTMYKRTGITPSLFIVATFLFSTIIGLLYYVTNHKEIIPYSYLSMVYYIAVLVIFLSPLIRNRGLQVDFSFPAATTKYFSFFLIAGGLISLFSSFQNFSFLEMMGNWAEIRSEYYINWGEQERATSIIERIESNVSHILFICTPLAFYWFTKKKKILGILLIIVSLTTIVQSLKDAERQDLLLWVANVLMSYLMFKDSFSKTIIKKVRSVIFIGGGVIVLLIGTITVARFGEDNYLIQSLYSYSGVQPYNAAYFLEHLSNQALGGRLNFPVFFGGKMILEINDYIHTDVFLNSFSSIVGSYYKDFGYFTIFVVAIVASLFDRIMSISKAKNSLLYFFIYCLYFNIMFVGVFYNKYTSPPMFRMVFFSIILIIILEVLTPQKQYGRIRYNDAL